MEQQTPKKRRRFGDRYDGRKLRSLDPLNMVAPFIMPTRTGSSNYYYGTVELDKADPYIRQKRVEGLKGFGLLAFFVAMYVRILSQRPGLNRFVAGRRLFARHHIDINLVIKKDMTLEGQETGVKFRCQPTDTAEDVYRRLVEAVTEGKEQGDSNGVDSYARILKRIPRSFLHFFVWLMTKLDYFGLMPKAINHVSPFHCTLFLADLGSIGLPPVHHHLYDFGTCPMFVIFGRKYKKTVTDKDGSPREVRCVDYTLTLDERVCDGFYFSGVLKMMEDIFKNPAQLDNPPEKVVEDVE